MSKSTISAAVAACFDYADKGVSVMQAVKDAFAGVPASKRDDVRTALYDAIRETDGRTKDGKLLPAKELTPRTSAAYAAARQAYRRLFATKGKASKKNKKSKAIVVPLARKEVSAFVKAAVSAIQSADSLPYDATKAVAALTAWAEVCGLQPKK